MYCNKCGSQIPDDSAFCNVCGSPVTAVKPASELGQNNPVDTLSMKSKEGPDITHDQDQHIYENPVDKGRKRNKAPIVLLSILGAAVVLAGLILFLLKGNTKSVDILEDKQKLAQITASCLMIECYDIGENLYVTGSGFVAFHDDYIVTNYHVIEDHPKKIIALAENGNRYSIDRIVAYNPDADLAILHVQGGTPLTPLSFSSEKTEKTDSIVAVGSPLGIMNMISEGIVSGFTQVGDLNVIQFTASISHGSSGGVLLNRSGEVVGVTFATITAGQNLNMAIPIEYVDALFNRHTATSEVSVEDFFCQKSYTISELWAYSNILIDTEVTVEGYISSYSPEEADRNGTVGIDLVLVEDKRDVLGIDGKKYSHDQFYNSDVWKTELDRVAVSKAISVAIRTKEVKIGIIQPGDYVKIKGKFWYNQNDFLYPYIRYVVSIDKIN